MATKRLLRNVAQDDDLAGLTVSDIKAEYKKLKTKYDKLLNGYYCHSCDKFLSPLNFYVSNKWKSGVVPTCKECLDKVAGNYNPKTKKRNETEESIKEALKIMDLPFIRAAYEASKRSVEDVSNTNIKTTVFGQMVTLLQTNIQYMGKSWADSDVEEEPEDVYEGNPNKKISKTKKETAIKRFGSGFTDSEYEFLENEYQDWISRYTCENKAQEILFIRICCKELELHKAQINGEDTKDLDRSLQELMASLNIRPSQKDAKGIAESKSLGQLIEMWEETKPIPEPSDEFKDVDKIGWYIDVFFRGHLSKMMGLKNGLSRLYEKYIRKYSVEKEEYKEGASSEELFEQIFGKIGDEDG